MWRPKNEIFLLKFAHVRVCIIVCEGDRGGAAPKKHQCEKTTLMSGFFQYWDECLGFVLDGAMVQGYCHTYLNSI
jgi:hypothetical protein